MHLQIAVDMAASAHLPALWSAEEPNVYVLVLSVVSTKGQHLDSESVQVILSSATPVHDVQALPGLCGGRDIGWEVT